MEVIWTKLAKITFEEILANINRQWTKKELKDFKFLTLELIEKINNQQITHPFANKNLGIRKGIIHKNVSLFYSEDLNANKIYLITFFNNRMNPQTLKELLNK